ncbi:MAG: DUF2270 domain-containing protein [Longimicrobiales bacterium]|nr:DUF2270 domain-containing protein [Longimicrobiales bacterium]
MAKPDLSDTTLTHFYRAVVGHADVWRQRMDATTNWAAATTAGMITFAFSNASSPHFVLLVALFFDGVFLIMESRRYQAYDRWRRQFHALNRYLIAPALEGSDKVSESGWQEILEDLSRTVPHLSLWQAMGYRMRRNYGYLFGVVLLAWTLKLQIHPEPAADLAETVTRADVGLVPASWVLALVGAFVVVTLVLIFTAPSEKMMDWEEIGSPWGRLANWSIFGSSDRPEPPTEAP